MACCVADESRHMVDKKKKARPTTRQIFMGMVLIMWATSYIMDLANPKYDPPDYVNPLIMLVGGYLIATSTNKEGK